MANTKKNAGMDKLTRKAVIAEADEVLGTMTAEEGARYLMALAWATLKKDCRTRRQWQDKASVLRMQSHDMFESINQHFDKK